MHVRDPYLFIIFFFNFLDWASESFLWAKEIKNLSDQKPETHFLSAAKKQLQSDYICLHACMQTRLLILKCKKGKLILNVRPHNQI